MKTFYLTKIENNPTIFFQSSDLLACTEFVTKNCNWTYTESYTDSYGDYGDICVFILDTEEELTADDIFA